MSMIQQELYGYITFVLLEQPSQSSAPIIGKTRREKQIYRGNYFVDVP